jgi:hypothetical protein
LFLKIIPGEIFSSLAEHTIEGALDPESEAKIIRQLHSLAEILIYDTIGESDGGAGGPSLEKDIDARVVENGKRIAAEGEVTLEEIEEETSISPRSLIDHSAIIDNGGNVFVFVYDTLRTWIFRSNDSGKSWISILPITYSFFPLTEEEKTSKESFAGAVENKVQFPYAIIDSSTGNCHLFFFSELALLIFSLPAEALLLSPDKMVPILDLIKPRFIYGKLTESLIDRGITSARPSRGGEEGETSAQAEGSSPVIPNQRVSVTITASGYFRVFLKDENGIILSLLSNDSGTTWFTDKEYSNLSVEAGATT